MGIFIGELLHVTCDITADRNVAWEDIKMYVTSVRSNAISVQDKIKFLIHQLNHLNFKFELHHRTHILFYRKNK